MSTYSLTLRQNLDRQMTCQEMDDNLLYLQDLANSQSNLNYSQTVGDQVTLSDSGTIVSTTIVTNGAPVQITITGDANPITGNGQYVKLQIWRNGSPVGSTVQAESSLVNENVPYTLNYIDEVSAGEYVYELVATEVAGGDFVFGEVSGPVITAVELVGRNWNQEVGSQTTLTTTGTVVSVNLSTSGGPVQIIASGDANPIGASGSWVQLQLFRDGDAIGNVIQAESSAINENVPFAINFIDEPLAGTYDYSLQVVAISNDFIFGEVGGPVITAVELFNAGDAWYQCFNSVCDSTNSNSRGGFCNVICCSCDATIIGGNYNYMNCVDLGSTIIGGHNNCIECCADASGIFVGRCNEICGNNSYYSAIIGGERNSICNYYGYSSNKDNAIIAGCRNCICENVSFSSVIAGKRNIVSYNSDYSTVIGGCRNCVNSGSCLSSIIGGCDNCLESYSCQSVILGGYCNEIIDNNEGSIVLGGTYNDICSCSNYSSIIGGYGNCLHDCVESSSILAGCCNEICYCVYNSTIIGGCDNNLYCCTSQSSIIGGSNNDICGGVVSSYYGDPDFVCRIAQGRICDSSILGGCGNRICDGVNNSSIIGGERNILRGNLYTNLCGGYTCNSCNSTIIGGKYGVIESSCNSSVISSCACSCYYSGTCVECSHQSSIIASSGYNPYICNAWSSTMISSYESCMCDTDASSIIGGYYNAMYSSCRSAILGGYSNCINQHSKDSSITGGKDNHICCSRYSSVTGGFSHELFMTCDSNITGGQNNIISGNEGYICGFNVNNTIIGSFDSCICNVCTTVSSIVGSRNSRITYHSCYSSIISGCNNTICEASNSSSIIGGCNNTLCGSCNSVIIGSNNITLNNCSNVVVVPKLITGTVSSPSLASWKLGTTASAVVVLDTTQYIEVEINGVTYKLALANLD